MKADQVFFFLSDLNKLVEEAVAAGGTELGIVIKSNPGNGTKPKLRVSYLKPSALRTVETEGDVLTNAIDGCPFPPRCS